MSCGVFIQGQFKPYTTISGDILGIEAYEVADPEPSGNRKSIFVADLGLPWSLTEVA